VEERLFFGSLPDGQAPKNGDEEESRRAGHFFVVGREYWDLRHAAGIKLLDLGSRSRAQKAVAATITIMRQIFRIAARKMLTSLVRMYLTFLCFIYMINVGWQRET